MSIKAILLDIDGNAIDDLKNVAFDVKLDNDHDGIVEAIYKYIHK